MKLRTIESFLHAYMYIAITYTYMYMYLFMCNASTCITPLIGSEVLLKAYLVLLCSSRGSQSIRIYKNLANVPKRKL